ncbi:trypsin-like peptidase domain-containing protein [Yinghuangia sp. YIM S09857]|uniref:trypsin-like peptidase domain-containing protein n=1 Tax=Yinghuangia sp. YIM S09857 TaxID=3436929 RepID=UPI003F52BD16
MGDTPPQRTVEVVNPRAGVRGSGCLIGPGLVLAAGHVACPNRDSGPVVVRALEGGAEHEASVLWIDTSLDVALLQADRALLGADLGIVRWGALTGDHPGARPVCTTIGFPQALHRKVPGGPRSATQAQTLHGAIAPRGRARSGMYVFELAEPDDVSFDLWQGMSGAAVYCDDAVVGVATNAADYWRGETLLVLPAFRLLGAPGFADAVAAATGLRPRLRPADLGPLLTEHPDPHLSASYLLDPAAQVVPMSGDAATVRALRAWCFNGRRTDVAAMTGPDGAGKTRLAHELLGHLTRDVRGRAAWTGGFVARVPRQQEPGFALFTTVRQPLMLVVDGAEARLDQVHALFDVLGERRSGQPVRVLLIVRGREDWWPRLRAVWTGSTVMGRGETFRVATTDAFVDVGAEALYERAARAFADRIRLLRHAGIDDDLPDRAAAPDPERPRRYTVPEGDARGLSVGTLHMAALADVLTRVDRELAYHQRPLDVLLRREEEHVRRIARMRMPSGLIDAGLLRTLLAVQQLVGAQTFDDALGAVRAGFEVHHRGRGDIAAPQVPVLAAYEDILSAAYPSGHGARWGAIGPDALASALVAEVEAAGDGTFLAALLSSPHLTDPQRYRALALLAHAASTQPELVASAARAVAASAELLVPIAEWVPAETTTARGRDWLVLCRDAVVELSDYGRMPVQTAAWATGVLDAALARLHSQGDVAAPPEQPSPFQGVFVPRPRGPIRPGADPRHDPRDGVDGDVRSQARGEPPPGPQGNPAGGTGTSGLLSGHLPALGADPSDRADPAEARTGEPRPGGERRPPRGSRRDRPGRATTDTPPTGFPRADTPGAGFRRADTPATGFPRVEASAAGPTADTPSTGLPLADTPATGFPRATPRTSTPPAGPGAVPSARTGTPPGGTPADTTGTGFRRAGAPARTGTPPAGTPLPGTPLPTAPRQARPRRTAGEATPSRGVRLGLPGEAPEAAVRTPGAPGTRTGTPHTGTRGGTSAAGTPAPRSGRTGTPPAGTPPAGTPRAGTARSGATPPSGMRRLGAAATEPPRPATGRPRDTGTGARGGSGTKPQPAQGGSAPRHRATAAHGLRAVPTRRPEPGPGRLLFTFLALAYLALVAYAACDTFYFTGRFSDTRLAWVFPPVVLLVDVEATLQSRHWPGRPKLTDLPAQLLAVAVTTTAITMYAGNHYPDLPVVVRALLAAAVSTAGMFILTEAVRRWMGRVAYRRA